MVLFLLYGGAFLLIAGSVLIFYRARVAWLRATKFLSDLEQRKEQLRKDLETERRETFIKLKDELYKKRSEFDAEIKKERQEIDRIQDKLNDKYEGIEKKEQRLDEIRRELQLKEKDIQRATEVLKLQDLKSKSIYDELIIKLEQAASMTREEAQYALMQTLESEVRHAQEKWIQKTEDDARHNAKERAVNIVVSAMQRYTADQVGPHSSGVVHLPNDEMKGRIIGKEGRNIKALEMATGMEFVIGDTPEVITISGFNPIRREVARRALEKLIYDGRINPTRIEETVQQCEKEIDQIIEEQGKQAILQFNLQGVKPEIVSLLGKLYFRTSYSQNVLMHSIEVALFARMIAEELGLPHPEIALRGGLFHDIGKALSAEHEGPHALIGAEVAKRNGENPLVVNAIAAHHEEVPFLSVYSIIVMIADTISAARPGARRETLSTYLKRLEKLEELAYAFQGVKKAYAVQAGREIRVIVEEDMLTDDEAHGLARELARKIERDMAFPGQIKVNVIREKRAIEYAR